MKELVIVPGCAKNFRPAIAIQIEEPCPQVHLFPLIEQYFFEVSLSVIHKKLKLQGITLMLVGNYIRKTIAGDIAYSEIVH